MNFVARHLYKVEKKHKMKNYINLSLMIGFLLMATSGFAKTSFEYDKKPSIAVKNNLFAFKFYGELIKTEKENVFFSPFSISTALAMTYAGADKTTAEEIANTFYFGPNDEAFHTEYGEYLKTLLANSAGNIELEIANRLWAEANMKFLAAFLDLNERLYNSPLEKVDFVKNYEASRILINDWVALKTKDKIKDLIPQGAVSPETRLILTNAIYFKGDWKNQFDKELTEDKSFVLSDAKKITVPFMNARGLYNYAETTNAKFIRLPYNGDKHSMIIALPNQQTDLSMLEEQMTPNRFADLYKGIKPEVILSLPKFKMTLPLKLKAQLKAMGMKLSFETGANFSKMTEQAKLHVSEVIHKAFIEVDEKGTEAAAATAVVMAVTSSISHDDRPLPKVFNADHPFLIYILDDQTQSILFMGRVMNPTAS